MKETSPTRIVETIHEGFQDFGWKSEKERQSLVFVWKRPLGVIMRIAGGLKG